MANKTIDGRAKCPFFLADLRSGVRCEGLTDGETLILAFDGPEKKKRHEAFYCCDMYGHEVCPVFRALMAIKYAAPEGPVPTGEPVSKEKGQ